MLAKQCILVLAVGLSVTAGLNADRLSGLTSGSQTESSREEYTISNPEPPDNVGLIDSSELTPTGPIEAVTARSWREPLTNYAGYAHWFSDDTSFPYPNDAVGAYLDGFSIDAPGDGSSSKVFAIYGLDYSLEPRLPTGESSGGGPGPASDTPEAGTFLMAFAALSMASTLHIARKHFVYRW